MRRACCIVIDLAVSSSSTQHLRLLCLRLSLRPSRLPSFLSSGATVSFMLYYCIASCTLLLWWCHPSPFPLHRSDVAW